MARGIYLRQEVQWWQPGANTVAYYPFTSQTTVYDQSWNQNDLTNAGGVIFTHDYAEWGSRSNLYNNNFVIPSTVYMWVWVNAFSFEEYNDRILRSWSDCWMMYAWPWDNSGVFRLEKSGVDAPYIWSWTAQTNKRYYVFTTGTNGSSLKGWFIDNGVMQSINVSFNMTTSGIVLGEGTSGWYDSFRGYMSELIIEDKVWTDQEIMDYFNLTKSNYGL